MAVAVEVVVGVTRRVEEWDRLRPTTRGTEMGLLVVSGSLSVCAFSSSSSSVKDNTGSGIFSINCFALSFSQRIFCYGCRNLTGSPSFTSISGTASLSLRFWCFFPILSL